MHLFIALFLGLVTNACDFLYIFEDNVQIGVGTLETTDLNKRNWWSGDLTTGEQFTLYFSVSSWTLSVTGDRDYLNTDQSGSSIPVAGTFQSADTHSKDLTFECRDDDQSSTPSDDYCAFVDIQCGHGFDGRYVYSHSSQLSGPVYTLESNSETTLELLNIQNSITWTIDISDAEETFFVSNNGEALYPEGKTSWGTLRKDTLESVGSRQKCAARNVVCTRPENTVPPRLFPSNSPTLAPLVIQTMQFSGDYSTVISDLSQFLQACSEAFTPVTCFWAQSESENIEISFQGTDKELEDAIASINTEGELRISGYPSLPIASSTTSIASTQSMTDEPTMESTDQLSTTLAGSTTVVQTTEKESTEVVTESSTEAPVKVVKMEMTFSGLTSQNWEESKDMIKKVVADAAKVDKADVAVEMKSSTSRRVLETSVVEATITADDVESVQQSLLSTGEEAFQESFAREAEQAGITGLSLEGVSEPVISTQPVDDVTSDAPEETEEPATEEKEESETSDSDLTDLLILILAAVAGALFLCVCSYCVYFHCCSGPSYGGTTMTPTYDFNNYDNTTAQNPETNGWFVTKRKPEENALYAL